ncbi:MAG: stage II sporulation protein M [Bacillota bacterium]|nr:stage II sporulation protein M [Bacillota bacterium]
MGAACGALGHKAILPHMVSLIDVGLRASGRLSAGSGIEAALFIFLKNFSVVFLCALLGRGTRGVFPALVCFINGGILGFLGAVMRAYGDVSWWRYVAVLSPHGVIELVAVFAACTVGMLKAPVKKKLRLLGAPLAMLVVAAYVETWISSGLAGRIL